MHVPVAAACRASLVGRQAPIFVLVQFREGLHGVFHLGSRNNAVAVGVQCGEERVNCLPATKPSTGLRGARPRPAAGALSTLRSRFRTPASGAASAATLGKGVSREDGKRQAKNDRQNQ